jgi:hypothetical protein
MTRMLGRVSELPEAGYARFVASTQPAPPVDRAHRLGLAALTLGTLAVFVWLVASLASAAFGS